MPWRSLHFDGNARGIHIRSFATELGLCVKVDTKLADTKLAENPEFLFVNALEVVPPNCHAKREFV